MNTQNQQPLDEDAGLDVETATDEQPTIAPFDKDSTVINSENIVLKFKPFRIGDNEIDMAQGLFSSAVLNSLAQTCSREASREVFELRRAIFGEVYVAEGREDKHLNECFNQDGTLKEHYHGLLSEAQVHRAELNYASLMAITSTAAAIATGWHKQFANAPRRLDAGPQFGLKQNTNPAIKQNWIAIMDFDDAWKFYYSVRSDVLRVKRVHKDRLERDEKQAASGGKLVVSF